MGLFDPLVVKIINRSPPSFSVLADLAIYVIETEDFPRIRLSLEREAYAATVIGMLALVSHEITNEWPSNAHSYIADKTKLANSRLSASYDGALNDLARERVRELMGAHFKDDPRYQSQNELNHGA